MEIEKAAELLEMMLLKKRIQCRVNAGMCLYVYVTAENRDDVPSQFEGFATIVRSVDAKRLPKLK